MPERKRLQTGIAELDRMLGGGLIAGTLTVVVGATGIGKTQLGLHFAHRGVAQEGEPGVILEMMTRGDSQNHRQYAARLFAWRLREQSPDDGLLPDDVFDPVRARCDYIHLFARSGRHVTFHDLEPNDWREWKVDLNRKLDRAIAFFYGNLIHGARRVVVDGVEPTDRPSDNFQYHVFDHVYHQILKKQHDWVARDLFRAAYRAHEEIVARHPYNPNDVACLLLHTSHEVMLDDLIARPIESGDALSNANTVILMGKTRDGNRMGRALAIAKHRGSPCDASIVPFEISERGLVVG